MVNVFILILGEFDGKPLAPYDAVYDGVGQIFIADGPNNRILECDIDGNLKSKLCDTENYAIYIGWIDAEHKLILQNPNQQFEEELFTVYNVDYELSLQDPYTVG